MISVIIPHWPYSDEINDTLDKCVESLGEIDELLIMQNFGAGYAPSVNAGLYVARGDYLAVVNNDIRLTKGSLRDLCKKETVCSPRVNSHEQSFHGALYVIPRYILEIVGMLDTRFEMGFWEDDDYAKRLELNGVETLLVDGVVAEHIGGETMKTVESPDNRVVYNKKWGAPDEV